MKIGIENYPFIKFSNIGPKVFLTRLTENIKDRKLAQIKSSNLPFYDIGLFSVLAKNFYKIPYILRFDGLYMDKNNTVGNSDKLNKILFDKSINSHGIVFQTEFCKKLYTKNFDGIKIKNTVILNRIPRSFNKGKSIERKKIGFKNDDIIVVLSSNWRRHKRLEEALQFLNFFNSKNSKKIKYLVLGKTKIKNNIENVYFAREVPTNKLSEWYNLGDFYFHPAWLEPAANTIVEAIGCNLPVVCCNNGGPSQMIKKFNAGIISNCDKEYSFEKVDLYNPPKPDFEDLYKCFNLMIENLKNYKKQINYEEVFIDKSTDLYINFISETLNK